MDFGPLRAYTWTLLLGLFVPLSWILGLLLGLSMLAGGVKYKAQHFSREASGIQVTMLVVAVIGLVMPALYVLSTGIRSGVALEEMSLGIAGILLLAYVFGLFFSLRTHRDIFNPVTEVSEKPRWEKRFALSVLVASTVLVAVESEILVGSLETARLSLGLTQLFVGVIILAIIGNAAENGSAILMSCGVADDGHDDDSDEQLGQAEAQPCSLQGADQDLALDGDQDGRCDEDAQRKPFFPTRFLGDLGDRIEDVPMRPQGEEQAEYVGEEQDPGNAQAHFFEGHAGADARGEHVQGGHHEADDRDDEHRDLDPGRLPGEMLHLVLHAAREHAQPEDQKQVPDDRAGERRLHDLRQTARQGKDRDDEFGRVPERRVQEAADSGTGVFSEFLRGEAEEPGKRDDGETRDREDDYAGPEEQVEDPTQRDKEPQQERPGIRPQRLEGHRAPKCPTVLNSPGNV